MKAEVCSRNVVHYTFFGTDHYPVKKIVKIHIPDLKDQVHYTQLNIFKGWTVYNYSSLNEFTFLEKYNT